MRNEFLFINGLALLLLGVMLYLQDSFLRILLGLPFILFFPGYVLIAALFPGKKDLDGIERAALSFGTSIAVVPLLGLILNYTPFGIRLYPVYATIAGFTLIMSTAAVQRRRALPEEERFRVPIVEVRKAVMDVKWREMGGADRVLSILLVLSILGAVGALVYVIVTPKVGERFTEFYILGSEGKAEGYPRDLTVGEEAGVIVGVVNNEYEAVEYRVEVRLKGEVIGEVKSIRLGHEEKWERRVTFVPGIAGDNMNLKFLLYKGEGSEAYRTLHLWVKVSP